MFFNALQVLKDIKATDSEKRNAGYDMLRRVCDTLVSKGVADATALNSWAGKVRNDFLYYVEPTDQEKATGYKMLAEAVAVMPSEAVEKLCKQIEQHPQAAILGEQYKSGAYIKDYADEIRQLIRDEGLECSALTPRLPVAVGDGVDKKVYSHAMVSPAGIFVYESRDDAYDDKNGVSIATLSEESRIKVLDAIRETYGDMKREVTVHVDTAMVPGYALAALTKGDYSGLDADQEKAVRAFAAREAYNGCMFIPRNTDPEYCQTPAFGKGDDCVRTDIVRTSTISVLREEHQGFLAKRDAVLVGNRENALKALDEVVKSHPLPAGYEMHFPEDKRFAVENYDFDDLKTFAKYNDTLPFCYGMVNDQEKGLQVLYGSRFRVGADQLRAADILRVAEGYKAAAVVETTRTAANISTERERVIAGRYADEGMYDARMWPDKELPGGYQSFGFEDMQIVLYKDMPDMKGTPLSALPYEQQVAAMDIIDGDMDRHLSAKMTKALSDEVWTKLDGLLPENGDKLVLNEPFTISKADGLKDGITIEVKTVSRGISPDYERDVFLCGTGDKGINTFRMNRADLQTLNAMVDGKAYTLVTAEKQDATNAELREAKGALRDVLDAAREKFGDTFTIDTVNLRFDDNMVAPIDTIKYNPEFDLDYYVAAGTDKDGGHYNIEIQKLMDLEDVKALTDAVAAKVNASQQQAAGEGASEVKKIIVDELTTLDNDYYHTAIDFKAMVDDAKVETADDVKDVVSRLAKEMLYEADSKDYDLLSRFGHETGYVFDIDKETGVINSAMMVHADGDTESLDDLKGKTLDTQIGKDLAGQILAAVKTSRIMSPVLPADAGLAGYFNDPKDASSVKDIQMIVKSFKETADSPLKTTYTVKVNDTYGIENEAQNIAEDIAAKVKSCLSIASERQDDVLAEKLMDLNAAIDDLAKAERRYDPQYLMKKSVESYFIQPKADDPSLVALCAVRDGDNELVSSYITYPEQIAKVDALLSDVVKARKDLETAKAREKETYRQPVTVTLPDGRELQKANVFKLTQGPDAGKYALYGIIDERKTMKIMDNAVPEQRALLTEYFAMNSAGHRADALTFLANRLYGEEPQKAAADAVKQDAVEPSRSEAPLAPIADHPRFKAMPSMSMSMSLLYHAISEAAAGHVLANPSFKAAPALLSGGEVSPWNALMMSLFSDANGYRGNSFMMYDDGKAEHCHVLKDEKGLPFTATDDSKYRNRHIENDIIDKAAYDAKDPKEQALYVMVPSRKTSNIFNIDQTSLFSDNQERYNALVNADVEQSGRSANPYQMYYQEMRLEHTGDVLLMKVNDSRFEVLSPDLNKISEILGKSIEKSGVLSDNTVGGREKMDVIVLANEDVTEALRSLNGIDYRCMQFDPLALDAIDSYDRQYPEKVYKPVVDLVANLKALDPGHIVSNHAFATCYDRSTGILSLNNSMDAAPGEASSMALTRTEDIYRAVAAYLGSADVLNRRASLQLLPNDMEKYDRLVQELSSAAMMVRRGYPATLSADNRPLCDYWLREVKECPALAQRLEADVNKTVAVMEAVTNGERVDYTMLRELPSFDIVDDLHYSIANELSAIPDAAHHQVVVIRDEKNASAAVILPQGASQVLNNEAEAMSRNSFILALRDNGIDNVTFYNAGGMLALVKPNDFFADKTAEVCRIDGYLLTTVDSLALEGEIIRSRQVQLRQVELVPDNNDRNFLLIIPYDGEPLTVYPDKKDVTLLQEHSSQADYDDVREAVGRKYYKMLQKHPELDQHLLSPETLGVDMHRISDVKISKDKANPGAYILSAVINGETFESRDITPFEQRSLWLVPDTEVYKMCLAAQKFNKELGIDEGLGDARFHTGAESASDARDEHQRQPGGLGV